MKRLEEATRVTVPLIFGMHIFYNGWGWPVLDAYALTISICVLFTLLFGIPLFVNLIGRMFGSSELLLGVELKEPKEDTAPWWLVLIWPLMTAGLVLLIPPGESEDGWAGVATLLLICAMAFGFEWLFKRFGRAFFVGDWLFAKKADQSSSTEVKQ